MNKNRKISEILSEAEIRKSKGEKPINAKQVFKILNIKLNTKKINQIK